MMMESNMTTRQPKKNVEFHIHKAIFSLNMPDSSGVVRPKTWWMEKTRKTANELLTKMTGDSNIGEKWNLVSYFDFCRDLAILAGKDIAYGEIIKKDDRTWAKTKVNEGDLSIVVLNVRGDLIYHNGSRKYFSIADDMFSWHADYENDGFCFGRGFFDDYPRGQRVKIYYNKNGNAVGCHPEPISVEDITESQRQKMEKEGIVLWRGMHRALVKRDYVITTKGIDVDFVLTLNQWERYKGYLDGKNVADNKETITWYNDSKWRVEGKKKYSLEQTAECYVKKAVLPEKWRENGGKETPEPEEGLASIAGYKKDGQLVSIWTVEDVESIILETRPPKEEFVIIWGGDEIEGHGNNKTNMFTDSDLAYILDGSKTNMFFIVCANHCGDFGKAAEQHPGYDFVIFNSCSKDETSWSDGKEGDYFIRYLLKQYEIEYSMGANAHLQYIDWYLKIAHALRGTGNDTVSVGSHPKYLQTPRVVGLGSNSNSHTRLWLYFADNAVPERGYIYHWDETPTPSYKPQSN